MVAILIDICKGCCFHVNFGKIPCILYVTQNYPPFFAFNAFLSRLIDIPARMIPYNSQNNDALIKELKFALKSVRE
jgi:hypothetical protein